MMTSSVLIAATLIGNLALAQGQNDPVVQQDDQAVPGPLMRMGRGILGLTRIWSIVVIVLGLALGLAGLTGRAGFI